MFIVQWVSEVKILNQKRCVRCFYIKLSILTQDNKVIFLKYRGKIQGQKMPWGFCQKVSAEISS